MKKAIAMLTIVGGLFPLCFEANATTCGPGRHTAAQIAACNREAQERAHKGDDAEHRSDPATDYRCKGTKDRKPYPVRLDLGSKTLTWFNLRFSDVRQVECDAMACFRGRHQDLVAVLRTATQGVADLTIQTKVGNATFECQQKR